MSEKPTILIADDEPGVLPVRRERQHLLVLFVRFPG